MGLDEAKNVAGRQYTPGQKQEQDEVAKGLQETHEQVMINYMEGTVDELIKREKENEK